jgi:hypothetical protein
MRSGLAPSTPLRHINRGQGFWLGIPEIGKVQSAHDESRE